MGRIPSALSSTLYASIRGYDDSVSLGTSLQISDFQANLTDGAISRGIFSLCHTWRKEGGGLTDTFSASLLVIYEDYG